jgi:hypothetical protein
MRHTTNVERSTSFRCLAVDCEPTVINDKEGCEVEITEDILQRNEPGKCYSTVDISPISTYRKIVMRIKCYVVIIIKNKIATKVEGAEGADCDGSKRRGIGVQRRGGLA